MPTFPNYRQLDLMDCGPTCLRIVAQYFGKHYSAQDLREKSQISRDGVSLLGLSDAAESIGFKTVGIKVSLKKLAADVPLPCILHWSQNHFVVLYKVQKSYKLDSRSVLASIWGGRKSNNIQESYASRHDNLTFRSEIDKSVFYISDPAVGLVEYSSAEFHEKWISSQLGNGREGVALLLEPTPSFFEQENNNSKGIEFGQLFFYLWQYKKLVFQLALGILVESALALLIPFLTQSVVDVGIATQDLSFINLILIAQMVLLISVSTVDFLRGWILLHISTRLNLTILSEFLSKIMRLPLSFFDIKQFGDIMQRIGDHQRIESFLTGQTLSILFSFFNLLIFGFVLAYYKFSIFVVALGFSILNAIWAVLFLKQRRKLDVKRFEISSKNQSQIVQLIQGMQDIKLAGAETSKRWEWERTQARLFKWGIRSLSLSQIQLAGGLLLNNGKNIFISFLSAKAVIDGQLTLGMMMSIQYILGQFNAPIELLIKFLQSWQDAKISLERLNEVHNLDDEDPSHIKLRTEWELIQDIKIENLSYCYPGAGNESVIKNINLIIPHGKTTAIVGTSGSGKTTLLKLLLRFYRADKGAIYLTSINDESFKQKENNVPLGINIERISHRAWRQECGVVMQDGFIFSDTIAKNVAVGEEIINKEKLVRALKTANIHEYVESLPLGFQTKIGAEGNGISQGQKQRILIARAVYKNPSLLLFDEATNSLDSNNEAVILNNLEEFFHGRTVVVVAHRLSTVKNADQIVVMENGAIVEQGTHAELLAINGKYFQLVSNQLDIKNG